MIIKDKEKKDNFYEEVKEDDQEKKIKNLKKIQRCVKRVSDLLPNSNNLCLLLIIIIDYYN